MASLSVIAPAITVSRDARGTHVEIPAGVNTDEPVVVDANLISSRTPADLGPWMKALIAALG